jgi:hypothetical protein
MGIIKGCEEQNLKNYCFNMRLTFSGVKMGQNMRLY